MASAAAAQPPMAMRLKQDGAAVTDLLNVDATGSVYDGPSTWCELPSKGETARQLAHGAGTLTLADGRTYVGEFQCGRRHGHGTWTAGDVYKGRWRNDVPYGKGTRTGADGSVYDGEWKGGRAHGHGTKVEPDGSKYVGDFVADRRHGHGHEYDASGALVREGEWRDGAPYEPPAKPKKRTYAYADRIEMDSEHCVFVAKVNERIRQIAKEVGCTADDLVALNAANPVCEGLQTSSKLKAKTRVWLPVKACFEYLSEARKTVPAHTAARTRLAEMDADVRAKRAVLDKNRAALAGMCTGPLAAHVPALEAELKTLEDEWTRCDHKRRKLHDALADHDAAVEAEHVAAQRRAVAQAALEAAWRE